MIRLLHCVKREKIGVINTSLRQTEQICMLFGAKTLLVMHCWKKVRQRIYRGKLAEDSWAAPEELYRTDDTISDFAYGYVGDEFSLVMVQGETLFVNGETIATADTGMQAVKCIDGKIYFIQDGTLMRYAGGKTENLRIACSSSYDVYEDVALLDWAG